MRNNVYRITPNGEASKVYDKIKNEFYEKFAEFDKIVSEVGLPNGAKPVSSGEKVVGFKADWDDKYKGVLKQKDNYLVPDTDADGVEIEKKLADLHFPSKGDITKAFGGEPIEENSIIYFIQIRFLGEPMLFIPEGMNVSLPEGLEQIAHFSVGKTGDNK